MVDKEKIIEVLKTVVDPELNIDIWTLELIYNIDADDSGRVDIKMTFTSPGCPFGPVIVNDVKHKLKEVEGAKEVNVDVVFEPPWKPSDELRAMLGV